MPSGELVSIRRSAFSSIDNSPSRTERMKKPDNKKGAEKTYGKIESRISKSLPVIKKTRIPTKISTEGARSRLPSSMFNSCNITLMKLAPAKSIART